MGDYTEKLNFRVRTRGPNNGYCAICGKHEKLARDHVPPKRCNNISDYIVKVFAANKNDPGVISQGGTHFKTLCESCNSNLLGTKYDPELIKLTDSITKTISSSIRECVPVPPYISESIHPQRLARAIVGHTLSAIAVEETKSGIIPSPLNDALRHYFLNENESLPDKLEIFYWAYPSKKQVIIKNSGKASIYNLNPVIGHIIKFFPLGFWLVWDRHPSCRINLPTLINERESCVNSVQKLIIDLHNIPPLNFPEAPVDHEIHFMDVSHTSIAEPKN